MLKIYLSHFSFFRIVSYFTHTNLISSLLDPKFVVPGSTLIHVGTYGPLVTERTQNFNAR